MSPTAPGSFAERLKEVMEQSALTQIDLARKIGVTQSAVSLWLRDTVPSRKRIKQIAIHLGLDENWLQTGEGSKDLPLEARQARENAKAVQSQTVQRLVGDLHKRMRTITLSDTCDGIEKVLIFNGATDEQWALIVSQIEATHNVVAQQGRASHPTI